MLNISNNQLNKKVTLEGYSSHIKAFKTRHFRVFNMLLLSFGLIVLIFLFLPWTQNVSGKGYVTTLTPDQRPQTIQSPIPGRIEKWFIREGDYVKKGDTILFISEIKNEYQDPQLVSRTMAQRDAKSKSVTSFQGKISALQNQIGALSRERSLKIQQAENELKQAILKVKSDSIDLEAANTNRNIAQIQFDRSNILQQEGLKAITDVEEKRLKLQETEAKLISQENKLLASRNSVINAQVEISRLAASYADKIAKASSERFTAESNQFETEAEVSKLENSSTNYEMRNAMAYISLRKMAISTRPLSAVSERLLRKGRNW